MTHNQVDEPISIPLLVAGILMINFVGLVLSPDDRVWLVDNEITKITIITLEFLGGTLGSMLVPILVISTVVLARKYIFKKERNKSKERNWLIVGVAIWIFFATYGNLSSYERNGFDTSCYESDLWICRSK